MRTVVRLGPIFVVACLLDCTTFPGISGDTCGNGIVDRGEDCDSFPNGDGTSCRAPGTALSCRLDCSKDAQGNGASCPPGWGCGTEGVCRQPNGKFERQQQSVSAGAWHLAMGDFDGDKRKDVLTRQFPDSDGASKLRVHYFDGNAAIAKTFVVAPTVQFPEIVRFDNDAIDDLTFCQLSGVDTLLGQADRTLVPVAYPHLTFPSIATRLVPIRGMVPSNVTSFLVWLKDQNGSIVFDPNDPTPPILKLDIGPDALAGDLVVADLVPDASAPCDEVVFAAKDATVVQVWSSCKRQGADIVWNDGGAPIAVALPAGKTVSELGTRAADIDGDGRLDLLIGTLQGTNKTTLVAYGTGTGFRSKPAADPTGELGKADDLTVVAVSLGESYSPQLPLAVGDLSGDGRPDFVSPDRILTSRTTATGDGGAPLVVYETAVEKTPVSWSQAVIADMNGNGLLDAIAGSDHALDLDFFNGTGGVWLHPFSIATSGSTSHFALGDVDGDLFPDLAFAQSAGDSTSGDALSILFGKPGGPPDLPTTVGQFQKIVQTIDFTGLDAFGHEPIAELAVVERPVAQSAIPVYSIALLAGSGDRQPLSLQGLSRGKAQAFAFTATPGAFVDKGTLDVAAIGKDFAQEGIFRLWFVKGAGNATFQGAFDGPVLPPEFRPSYIIPGSAGLAILQKAGDLDGDGISELVIAAPFNVFDGSKSALYIAKVRANGDQTFTFDMRAPIRIDVMTTQEGQLELQDVDRDGALDVVLLTGVKERSRAIVVYWNDGHGNFDQGSSLVVNDVDEAPLSFAFASVSAAEPPAFAYVTRTSVFVAHVDAKARAVRREKIDSAHGATGIAAGDVDGDGIDDLAVADLGNVVILRGQAVLP